MPFFPRTYLYNELLGYIDSDFDVDSLKEIVEIIKSLVSLFDFYLSR